MISTLRRLVVLNRRDKCFTFTGDLIVSPSTTADLPVFSIRFHRKNSRLTPCVRSIFFNVNWKFVSPSRDYGQPSSVLTILFTLSLCMISHDSQSSGPYISPASKSTFLSNTMLFFVLRNSENTLLHVFPQPGKNCFLKPLGTNFFTFSSIAPTKRS